MDFVPDYTIAKRSVTPGYVGFTTYSRAYAVTNENLHKTMCLIPKNAKSALVTAASGDHPLFCSLRGIENVDTFDISYNAKCIMDIKVIALKYLGYHNYMHLLDDLFMVGHRSIDDFADIKHMPEILCNLPKIESDYLHAVNGAPLFSSGVRPTDSDCLFSSYEYSRLRKKVTKPYNFILTDIHYLGKRLTKSYDFIHLSNILDYVSEGDYKETIVPLMEHVNVGGRIVAETYDEEACDYFNHIGQEIANANSNWIFSKKVYISSNFYKTRSAYLERIR